MDVWPGKVCKLLARQREVRQCANGRKARSRIAYNRRPGSPSWFAHFSWPDVHQEKCYVAAMN
jgi:hypothetical protein